MIMGLKAGPEHPPVHHETMKTRIPRCGPSGFSCGVFVRHLLRSFRPMAHLGQV